ncbi:MAG: 4-alpha-glucanotransferase, partial [Acetobacteraceae bacterium]
MSDAALLALAEAAGLLSSWEDAFGKKHTAAPDTLRRVLAALDLPAGTDAEVADSHAHLLELRRETLAPLVTTAAGKPITLRIAPGRFEIMLEDGSRREGTAQERDGRALLPAIEPPGYHHLVIGDREATLAVAPATCFSLAEIAPGRKLWGLSAQLYGLRREGDGGIGDFAGLRDLVRAAAVRGAAAVAVSPVHAQFSADCDRFSPYAPSSRVMLNALHADAGDASDAEARALEQAPLIDWPAAARKKLARLRAIFASLRDRAALDRFRAERGDTLEQHARFEALHGHIWGNDPGRWHWRTWPEAYRDPDSPAVADFA